MKYKDLENQENEFNKTDEDIYDENGDPIEIDYEEDYLNRINKWEL